jgi:anti-sigma factor RsiW
MADREHLELLASRLLDGDLSVAEREVLEGALANDPALREFAAELQRIHDSINLLAAQRLPADFTGHVLDGITPVHNIGGWRHWAAAAAILLTVGVLVSASVLNNSGAPAPIVPIAKGGGGVVSPPDVLRGPSASVVAFSTGNLELVSLKGREVTNRFEGELALPAEVAAPADTYAVVEVQGGTAVLSPGARARLADADADGLPDFEPIDGDLYLEGGMQSRVGTINFDTQARRNPRRRAHLHAPPVRPADPRRHRGQRPRRGRAG